MVERNVVYSKPRRFPFKNIKKNDMLSLRQVSDLLKGQVIVEEKMDGKPKDFSNSSYIIFAEDMKKQHTLFYILPGRYAIFDIYDKKRNVFVFSEEKLELSNAIRGGKIKVDGVDPVLFFPTPTVTTGKFTMEELPKLIGLSAYAHDRETKERMVMEGIVVKPDRDLFQEEFLSGKIVKAEFENGIKTHHLRMPARYNIINPSFEVRVSLS